MVVCHFSIYNTLSCLRSRDALATLHMVDRHWRVLLRPLSTRASKVLAEALPQILCHSNVLLATFEIERVYKCRLGGFHSSVSCL